jgi:hypothetical protein
MRSGNGMIGVASASSVVAMARNGSGGCSRTASGR